MNESESESGSQPPLSADGEEGEQPPNAEARAPGVDLFDQTELLDAETMAWLQAATQRLVRTFSEEGVAIGRVAVRLIGDEEMAQAHSSFSKIEGTTDVLAFVGGEDPLEIDILACVEEAERRAEEFGHELQRELMLYVVHAILHGLGHDDGDPESSQRMHAEEDRLLGLIGVGPVFKPSGCKGGGEK